MKIWTYLEEILPRFVMDIFRHSLPKNVPTKHYNPHGIRILKEVYEKANA